MSNIREMGDAAGTIEFGRIINRQTGAGKILSDKFEVPYYPVGLPIGVSLYAAGKAGAIGFMRHLALEVARSGVTANTLAIGLMNNQQDTEAVAPLAKARSSPSRLSSARPTGRSRPAGVMRSRSGAERARPAARSRTRSSRSSGTRASRVR